jgi:hypothetical protein
MGGWRFAQALAALCVMAAPVYFGSYLNMDMFMNLGWAACARIATRIFQLAADLARTEEVGLRAGRTTPGIRARCSRLRSRRFAAADVLSIAKRRQASLTLRLSAWR